MPRAQVFVKALSDAHMVLRDLGYPADPFYADCLDSHGSLLAAYSVPWKDLPALKEILLEAGSRTYMDGGIEIWK